MFGSLLVLLLCSLICIVLAYSRLFTTHARTHIILLVFTSIVCVHVISKRVVSYQMLFFSHMKSFTCIVSELQWHCHAFFFQSIDVLSVYARTLYRTVTLHIFRLYFYYSFIATSTTWLTINYFLWLRRTFHMFIWVQWIMESLIRMGLDRHFRYLPWPLGLISFSLYKLFFAAIFPSKKKCFQQVEKFRYYP